MEEGLLTKDHLLHLMHPDHTGRRVEEGLQIRGRPTNHLVGIREVPLGDHRHHRHHRLLHLLTRTLHRGLQ